MWEWLIVGGLLLIVLERFFTGTYLLAMGAGLLAAGLVRYTGDSVFVQALVFLFVTGILTIWQTKIYRKTLKGKSPLIGKTVVVIEAVDKGKGRVKVDGIE